MKSRCLWLVIILLLGSGALVRAEDGRAHDARIARPGLSREVEKAKAIDADASRR